MKRTISVMVGNGSVNHNCRKFHAKNVNVERSHLNVEYCHEDIKDVYHELFDEALSRYNAKQTRKDRCIDDYYEKILSGKQEQPFHEIIVQIGNRDDTGSGTREGVLAAKILLEYLQDFQKRNPTLRIFSAHLHMDEATPHLHIDFVPYITGSKRGLDTRVSLKQALGALGYKGGTRSDTEWNQFVAGEKEQLALVMERHDVEWEKKGTHEKHLSVLDFEKRERAKEVDALELQKAGLEEENAGLEEHKAVMEEVSEKMLDQLEELEGNIRQAQDNLDKTEKEVEISKKKAEKYEIQIKRMAPLANDIRLYAGEFSKPVEEVLPEAEFLESAKSYREKKAKPLVVKLKELLYSLYLAYIKIREDVDQVQYKYRTLESSNKILATRNQEQTEVIASLREENRDYYRLKRAVGEDKADILVQVERNRETAEYEAKKALKKRHDRDER